MTVVPRSLFGRLLVVQVAAAAILAALLPFLISHLLISTTNSLVGRSLDRTAARLRPAVAYSGRGWMFTEPLPPMFDSKVGIREARLIDAAGRTLIDQGPHYRIPTSALPLRQADAHLSWNGIDIGTYPMVSNGHRAWLVISSDRRRPESLVANVAAAFLHHFLWIVPALILCSLIITLLFLAQATKAVRRASQRAHDIDGDRLDVRLDADSLPSEVRPLAEAVNLALDRVEEGYSRQAEFAANVAHELRNPLAIIGCRIDEIADPVVREQMISSLRHASHIIDQLMILARVGGKETALEPIDLRSMIRAAVQDSTAKIISGGRTIQLSDRASGAQLLAIGNESLARISLDNLIDNAQRHTPPGTRIRVTAGPGLRISVEDDGPGIPSSDRDRAGIRHWRRDDRSGDGAGLGLSIVSKAMAAQNGAMQISESSAGAKLELLFHPADPVCEKAAAAAGDSLIFQD
jgi:signal transduction histidine kinase